MPSRTTCPPKDFVTPRGRPQQRLCWVRSSGYLRRLGVARPACPIACPFPDVTAGEGARDSEGAPRPRAQCSPRGLVDSNASPVMFRTPGPSTEDVLHETVDLQS